jgi:hypothetical protein
MRLYKGRYVDANIGILFLAATYICFIDLFILQTSRILTLFVYYYYSV